MSDLLDFGRYAPFVFAAYGVSLTAIGLMVLHRVSALRKAQREEAAREPD